MRITCCPQKRHVPLLWWFDSTLDTYTRYLLYSTSRHPDLDTYVPSRTLTHEALGGQGYVQAQQGVVIDAAVPELIVLLIRLLLLLPVSTVGVICAVGVLGGQ